MDADIHPGMILNQELKRRKLRNPQYSLNKFAKDAGISPAQMSGLINNKRELTEKLALKIAFELKLSSLRSNALVEMTKLNSIEEKAKAWEKINQIFNQEVKSPNSLLGAWIAKHRQGQKGFKPNFWDPQNDRQVFIFESNNEFRHLCFSNQFSSITFGQYKLENDTLHTFEYRELEQGKKPFGYSPRMATHHEFEWIDENEFCLNSDTQLLTPNTLSKDDRLITFWEKYREAEV